MAKENRIRFLDSIRGMALLGILLMNIMGQSQPLQFYTKLNLDQPITGPNFFVWLVECLFFEGTMRGLFSILFGAGTLLLLNRLTKSQPGLLPADIFYRRMLWLLVFGCINAFIFLWPGDILYQYAICGLLLFPVRNWSARSFLWGALFFLAIGTYRENSDLYAGKKLITEGRAAEKRDNQKLALTPVQKEALEKWKGFREKNTSEGYMKEAREFQNKIKGKNYFGLIGFLKDMNMKIQSVFFYNLGWWDVLLFFFIGMALYRMDFLTGNKPTALYAAIAVVGIGTGLLLNYFLYRFEYQHKFDNVVFTEKWPFSYYEARRVFQTLGYLSLLILVYKLAIGKKLLHFFAPVGQMAFTNYLMQSILTTVLFFGFGLYGQLQRYEVYFLLLNIWIFQIAFSHIWLQIFRFGPFEWLWRSLTYWQRQPMLKIRGPQNELAPATSTTVS